jgi:transcriptional regulator with XRE-family HTH domain
MANRAQQKIRKATGKVLREYRKDLGLSQMTVGEEMGISYQQWQKYEGGKSGLSVFRLFQAAAVFGVNPEELVEAIRTRMSGRRS